MPVHGDLDRLPAPTGFVSAPTLRKASSAYASVAHDSSRDHSLADYGARKRQ
ncbi:hypothetical protein K0M31_010223 [Melipona bicolor]|uniref:Uncharacterized protein n=1 Tax=Melipona bicolor TaxID=60889 RepID=A0AA40FLK2_9HYME|nr:hypothetical protein K0M31_010223 [Melipona bicolor]